MLMEENDRRKKKVFFFLFDYGAGEGFICSRIEWMSFAEKQLKNIFFIPYSHPNPKM